MSRDAARIISTPLERAALIERAATAVGTHWCTDWLTRLARDGRAVEGGWPGTLSEALGLVGPEVRRALDAERMLEATHDEIERAKHTANDVARRSWSARRVRKA